MYSSILPDIFIQYFHSSTISPNQRQFNRKRDFYNSNRRYLNKIFYLKRPLKDQRRSHRSQREVCGARWELVLNYDQMWRSAYEPPKFVMHKRDAKLQGTMGEVRPDYLKGKRFNAVMEIVKSEMGKYLASGPRSEVRKTVPRSENIAGGRFGITAITSTWGNGEAGPLGMCVSSGSLPQSFITSFNSEWYGCALIFESGTESHFMTADTTILYFQELLGPVTCHTRTYRICLSR